MRQHFVEDASWRWAPFWWLFPLPFIIAADGIRFSRVFRRELALDPLMTLGRFDLTVVMAPGTVAGMGACDYTASRYACCEGSMTWHLLL